VNRGLDAATHQCFHCDISAYREWMHVRNTLEERDPKAFALLFSRSAWALPVGAELPGLDPEPHLVAKPPQDDHTMAEWDRSWRSWLRHAGDLDDFDLESRGLNAYFSTWQRTQRQRPRPWADRFPDVFSSVEYASWDAQVVAAAPTDIGRDIERLVVEAWRRGLTHISLLPFKEDFAARIGRHRLAVSHRTWSSGAVAEALADWSES
jgi:hypothetical protein